MRGLIKPRKLEKGDKVAVVSSSWGGPGTFPWKYEHGVSFMEKEFFLQVVPMPNALRDADWVYNNPQARAEDLMHAFSDPSIKAIISSIGGEDSIRMLPWIDVEIIRRNPKIFMGYSDTTISHFACFKAGLGSFYGPAVMSGFAENGGMAGYTIDAIRNILMCSEPVGIMPFNEKGWTYKQLSWEDKNNLNDNRSLYEPTSPRFLQGSSIVEGRLIGGCIEVLEFLKGTGLWPDISEWEDAILFLETSEEGPSPEMVKRWLRNYAAQGILHRIKALIFGRPGGCEPETFSKYDEAIMQVVVKEYGFNHLTIITMLDFGHTDPMYILPYGMKVEIDPQSKTIEYKEGAVV